MTADLSLALRANRGRQKLPQFVATIAEKLGRPQNTIELLPLIETDAIAKTYGEARSRAREEGADSNRVCFRASRSDDLIDAAQDLRGRLPEVAMVMIRSESRWCGGVLVRSYEVLNRLRFLIERDGEDLLACTVDGAVGVFCAWMSDNVGGDVYDFQAWW